VACHQLRIATFLLSACVPRLLQELLPVLPYEVLARVGAYQVAYGVAITSFLGAVHWGAAMNSSLGAHPGNASNSPRLRRLSVVV
jgi:hypothetical protein